MSFVKILLSVPDSATTMQSLMQLDATNDVLGEQYLQTLIPNMINGNQLAYAKVSNNLVQASGTGTFTGAATANQTMTICGVTFTAKASPTEASAQYLVSATVALEAASLVRAINLNVTCAKLVVATSALGVVTLTAVQPGVAGNFLPTVDVDTSNFTFAQDLLAGGTDGTEVERAYGVAS